VLGAHPAELALWRNNVGRLTPIAGGRPVQYGLVNGASDLIGVGTGGKFVAIEVKTWKGRASMEQMTFLLAVQRLGGVAMILKAADLEQATERATTALELIRSGTTNWHGWPEII